KPKPMPSGAPWPSASLAGRCPELLMKFARLITTAFLVCAATAPLYAAEGGNVVVEMGARLLNFGILVGALVYFLRSPIANYLASRSTQIRQDLVTASEMRAAATAQLAEIEKKMQALPAELEA